MKKNIVTLLIVVVLLVIAAIFYYTNDNGTIKKELRDFAVQDTASITKIFMVNKSNESVVLERKQGFWMVNDKYKVRKDAIYTLLKTLNRIEVKSPVSKSAHNTIVKLLATNSTKVEVYEGEKLIKTMYVGTPTSNHFGTNMLLEGSSVPFVVHIPGFNGYLTTRFFLEEDLWRNTDIFDYRFDEIVSVKVNIPGNMEQSFRILNLGNNKYDLESLSGTRKIEIFDTISVKTYIGYFKNIGFQALLVDMDSRKKDSIINTTPYYEIEVEDVLGGNNKLSAFYMPPEKGVISDQGEEFEFDPNQLYGYINNKDMASIQFYVFDPLFKELDDFLTN